MMLLFLKAYVGAYMRGGKMVNVAGYHGRDARPAAVDERQMGLFDQPSAPKPHQSFATANNSKVLFTKPAPSKEVKQEPAKVADTTPVTKQESKVEKVVIASWADMDSAAMSGVKPESLEITQDMKGNIKRFDPWGDWAQEPRLSFYWAALKVANAGSGGFEFKPEMYGSDSSYSRENDTNNQGEGDRAGDRRYD